jgi:hypothetical protein
VIALRPASSTSVLDQRRDLGRVLMLVEICDEYVGTLARVGDGHRAPNPAVAASDDSRLTGQPARAPITGFAAIGDRRHLRLHAWRGLMLIGKSHRSLLPLVVPAPC